MSTAGSLTELLYEGAEIDRSAVAVDDGHRVYRYDDLIARVEGMGAALQRRLGKPGRRVAICASNHFDHLVAYLAIFVSGSIWVPLNPANGRSLNSKIAARANPDLVLVDRDNAAEAPDLPTRIALEEIVDSPGDFEPVVADADDVAAIKFTGGTSGEPKGVVQTHGNMLAVIENLQHFYRFSAKDINLVIAPMTHGSSHYLFPVLARGGRHKFVCDRSTESILEALRAGTSTVFMPPTLIYKLLHEQRPSPDQFAALRHLTYSAAPMPPDRIAEAQAAFGPRISTLYGLTEAPVTICALGPREMQDSRLRQTVGRPCLNSRVRIVDEDRNAVPAGTVGQVEAHGPIVMRGYLDEPALTGETLRDGWLSTGDLGFLDDEGYLTLVGRANDVIITGGFNVHPAEIENAMSRVPGVRECCVFAVEDDYWGQRIEAAVAVDTSSDVSEDSILRFVRDELGPVRTPKKLHFLESLPRNAVGKVVRRSMREALGI